MTPAVIYAVFDGLFQQCLLKHLAGDPQAIGQMQADVRAVLARFARNPVVRLEQTKVKAVIAKTVSVKTGAAKPKQKTLQAPKRAASSRRSRS
jgi:hypothetical protein